MLVAARFVQGVGGAMTSAVILGMIVTMFPEPREQAKAIGVYAFVASAGGSIGLLAGGVLTQAINWHWIFFVNVPIGIATALLARCGCSTHDAGIGLGQGADVLGRRADHRRADAAASTRSSSRPPRTAGAPARTLALGAVALALLAAFIVREATAPQPADPAADLPLAQRRRARTLIQALRVAGMFGMFFLGALYLQRVLGYDALEIGLAFLPVDGRHGRRCRCATPSG